MNRHGTVRLLLGMLVAALVSSAVGLTGCANDDTSDTAGSAETTQAPESGSEIEPAEPGPTTNVSLFFAYFDGAAFGVRRDVPDSADLAFQVATQLVAGPTDTELQTWPMLHSEIPAGTRVLDVEVADGIAKIDLSGEFGSGGGSASMIMRVAQVVYTLADLPGIDAVEFYMEGERIDALGGEGLMLDEPQTPEDYADLVPIEA